MAGHSKWAQTKHKKAITDAKRSKIFSRLAGLISVAAREHGGDHSQNPKLRLAIDKAREFNMPQTNIERAIQRGTGGDASESLEEIFYEAYGPGGVALLIQTVTENKNRTLAELRHLLAEFGGKLAEVGSVRWIFEERGMISVPEEAWSDTLELALIERGAEDIEKSVGVYEVSTKPEVLESLRLYLETHGATRVAARREFVPKTSVAVSGPETKQSLEALFEALNEHDDVEEIYSNAAI